jgi:hypothetical protein
MMKGNSKPVYIVAMLVLSLMFVAAVFTFFSTGLSAGEQNLIDAFTKGLTAVD